MVNCCRFPYRSRGTLSSLVLDPMRVPVYIVTVYAMFGTLHTADTSSLTFSKHSPVLQTLNIVDIVSVSSSRCLVLMWHFFHAEKWKYEVVISGLRSLSTRSWHSLKAQYKLTLLLIYREFSWDMIMAYISVLPGTVPLCQPQLAVHCTCMEPPNDRYVAQNLSYVNHFSCMHIYWID